MVCVHVCIFLLVYWICRESTEDEKCVSKNLENIVWRSVNLDIDI